VGKGQQFGQGGQCSGGDEWRWGEIRIFDAACMNRNGGADGARGFLQEGSFSVIGFNEVDMNSSSDGQYEAGKAAPSTQIDGCIGKGCCWHEINKLECVLDMAGPNMVLIAPGNQVYPTIPPEK
jgi:hypothetical protein